MRTFVAVLLTFLSLLAGPASAQQQRIQCYDRVEGNGGDGGGVVANTYLNMVMTDRYRDAQTQQDPTVMAAFAGVWGGQSQQQGMVDTTYYSFEPNGLFQYQSQTCTPGAMCSQNYGTGEWTAREAQGGIEVMFAWSDMARTNACGAMVGAVQGNMFQVNTGFALQRVR